MAEEPHSVVPQAADTSTYCREIETYLCRKNEGHLIRIVGPAFEQVCSWAERGVPLKIAFRGIDRCCERHQAKGPRRRPVRIEFCEADVLDAFDDWRRAVGVGGAPTPVNGDPEHADRRGSLHAHIERAAARLLAGRSQEGAPRASQHVTDAVFRELQELASTARTARGASRTAIIERLNVLDSELRDAAIASVLPETAERLRREAEAELAPFAVRMAPQVHTEVLSAAYDRLVREALGLPTLRYE
jgi:hypothetical protein